jgi:hypothetical protein
MLSDDEIFRRIRTIKHSSPNLRYGWHLPSISGVAREAGISKQAIYYMLKSGSLGVSAARLSDALERYQNDWRARSSGQRH